VIFAPWQALGGCGYLTEFRMRPASSGAYLFNDLLDADADRHHHLKRRRPIASGALSAFTAIAVAVGLVLVAFGGAAVLGVTSLLLLGAFISLQGLYSLCLKRIVIVDVLTISGLFVVRAAAGAEAIKVSISAWLFACTSLLSLFIALNKRRGELEATATSNGGSRKVLKRYDMLVIDRATLVLAAIVVIVYLCYTITGNRSRLMLLTTPFVIVGVARYLYLVRKEGAGEEPERLLVGDVPLLATTFVWAASAASILLT
jgi:4-hydroxybenzoate polyprenyltransferase